MTDPFTTAAELAESCRVYKLLVTHPDATPEAIEAARARVDAARVEFELARECA